MAGNDPFRPFHNAAAPVVGSLADLERALAAADPPHRRRLRPPPGLPAVDSTRSAASAPSG